MSGSHRDTAKEEFLSGTESWDQNYWKGLKLSQWLSAFGSRLWLESGPYGAFGAVIGGFVVRRASGVRLEKMLL